MLRKFKCWFYGHDWVQKGYNRIRHTIFNGNDIIESVYKDHFLFFCRRCSEIREHTCEFDYFDLSEDAPVFAVAEEDEYEDEEQE